MANVSKMGFSILRLPILAIFEILSTMNPFGIVDFSTSSLRCKRIVKLYFRPGCKYELQLHIMDGTAISFIGARTIWEYEFTSEEKSDDILENSELHGTKYVTLKKYSTNIVDSLFNLFKHLDDLMNFKNLAFIHFNMPRFPLQKDLIIHEIKNFKIPIEHFEIFSEEDAGNDIIDMLNHVNGIKSLDLTASFNKDFELSCPPNLSWLYIDDSKWINLTKLLELNSSEIQIRDHELTDMDLCAFFQSWISLESHLKLEKIEIHSVERETFENISQSLPHEEHDYSVVRKVNSLKTREVQLESFYIKRNDGTWSTIYLVQNRRPDGLTLGMLVG
ncbi:unnamed protein product [Caenorhabditis brenneri]